MLKVIRTLRERSEPGPEGAVDGAGARARSERALALVVQWDQRGAGKSYSSEIPIASLNVERILADALELVDRLTKRFDQDRVFLVGHSWGSYLGMILAARHPDHWWAYIGVGQVVDEDRAHEIQNRFILREARERGREEAIREMRESPATVRENWLFELGGELHDDRSWWPLLWAGLKAPEYGLADVMNVAKGSRFSSRHMQYNAIEGPLSASVTSIDVPVYFFTGRFDYTTPFELIEDYYLTLEAPYKDLVWFEESAHFPFFEEPERFCEQLSRVRREVLSMRAPSRFANGVSSTTPGQPAAR